MPNHIHLIAVPEGATAMAQAIGRTYADYARYYNLRKRPAVMCGRRALTHRRWADLIFGRRWPMLSETPSALTWRRALRSTHGRAQVCGYGVQRTWSI